MFCDVYNGLTQTQIVFENLDNNSPFDIKTGDFVRCVGNLGATNSGQTSLFVEGFHLFSRPESYEGEDLSLKELLVSRARAKEIIRSSLLQYGLTEVDSRIMSPYSGTANIVPFSTHSAKGEDYQQVLSRLLSQFEVVKRERPDARLDIGFLEEFKRGLPPCLGVFISFDRLMMTLLEKNSIKEVMPEKIIQ
ncbi:MAG: amino acid--tRNA ligase-related protein [Patescibacteria group bacterium]|jgi:lysyl-tRNA synthetase class II